jgi:hypothetical protein
MDVSKQKKHRNKIEEWQVLDEVDELRHAILPLAFAQRECRSMWLMNMLNGWLKIPALLLWIHTSWPWIRPCAVRTHLSHQPHPESRWNTP